MIYQFMCQYSKIAIGGLVMENTIGLGGISKDAIYVTRKPIEKYLANDSLEINMRFVERKGGLEHYMTLTIIA